MKSGKGKEQQREEKEEAILPLSVAQVEKTENAPHLPRWMSGQCKLLKELLGGLGEWVVENMKGVEGGAGTNTLDSDTVLTDREDGGTPWDPFAWRVWVGMVRNQCEYGAKWGSSKKTASGQQPETKGVGDGGGGGGQPLHSLGFKAGWKWPCIRGNYVSRPWEVTPNGFRCQVSPTSPTSAAFRKG